MGIWFQDFARIENCETIHEKLTIRYIYIFHTVGLSIKLHRPGTAFIYQYLYLPLRQAQVGERQCIYRQKDAKDLVMWSRVREANSWDNFIERLYVKKVSSQAESKLTLCDYP